MIEKVLVIDDDMPSAQSLMWMVQAMGHEAHIALNGESALREIDGFVPDVVLCDITMPGMRGYELCEKMRADPRLKHTLFLAQSGHSSHESKQRSAEAGFHYHLVKPIDVNKLFDIVQLDRDRNAKKKAAPAQDGQNA